MNMTKEQIYGFSSSVILCLLIWLFLSFVFLRTEARAEEEGIPVELGFSEWASGANSPTSSGNKLEVPDREPIPENISQPALLASEPSVITQNNEQTLAIEAEKQRKAEQERLEAERKRLAEEQRQKDAINRQMADAFGGGNAANGSQGTAATGSGKQGSPQGNAATGAPTGTGGFGSFNLDGRSLRGSLPRPAYEVQEEGTIVVEITVNPQGDVIDAKVHPRGTNIENANMRRSAVEAAKKAKFNNITGVQNQIGTITYIFKLT